MQTTYNAAPIFKDKYATKKKPRLKRHAKKKARRTDRRDDARAAQSPL